MTAAFQKPDLSLTEDELAWLQSEHPLAKRIRFHTYIVMHWPWEEKPFPMLWPLILAMRAGRAGHLSALADKNLNGETKKVAYYYRRPLATIESAQLWYGARIAYG